MPKKPIKTYPTTELGAFIKEVRLNRDISQRELATMLGLSKAYVGHLEVGMYQYPMESLRTLTKLLTNEEKARLLDLMFNQMKTDLEI